MLFFVPLSNVAIKFPDTVVKGALKSNLKFEVIKGKRENWPQNTGVCLFKVLVE